MRSQATSNVVVARKSSSKSKVQEKLSYLLPKVSELLSNLKHTWTHEIDLYDLGDIEYFKGLGRYGYLTMFLLYFSYL